MANDTCLVMLHGHQIGASEVSLATYPGVKLLKTERVSNPNYLFLDLLISRNARPGELNLQLERQGTAPSQVVFPVLARENNEKEAVTSKDVIYLITPDRFANGDPANDSVPGMKQGLDRQNINGRHGGDIAGIREHLSYLKDLGITTLWINPLLENNMDAYSYHGYAITDFYRTDPRFGTNEDYRKLVEEARGAGMKVIMDMVMNHCGSNHWWMNDLPDDQWINLTGLPYQQTNHKKTILSDRYAAPEDEENMISRWFVPTMPDLNTRHPILSKYLIINTIWWIEYARVSGIRMDTYPYPDKGFMQHWAQRIEQEYPGLFIVGEVWHYQPAIIAYWQRGNGNRDGFDSDLPSLFDFPLQGALHQAFNEPEGWEKGLFRLYEAVALDFVYPDPDNLVTFADNHDMSRVFEVFKHDAVKTKNALAFLMTFRGIPSIFYGTELLMNHPGTDAHGAIRSDFPGGWPGDTGNAFSGTGLREEAIDFQDWLRRLLNWRKTAEVIHTGHTTHYAPRDGRYVFFRHNDRQKIMIIIQKAAGQDTGVINLADYATMMAGYKTARDVLTGEDYDLTTGTITLSNAEDPVILYLEK